MAEILHYMWAVWLLVGLAFLLVELLTTALVSIWFVPAAVLTAVLSIWVESVPLQIFLFLGFSLLFVVLFKVVYQKYVKKDVDDVKKEHYLIGTIAKTTEDTDETDGKVLVGDVYWRAVCESGEQIPKHTTVQIMAVQNTTLLIKRKGE